MYRESIDLFGLIIGLIHDDKLINPCKAYYLLIKNIENIKCVCDDNLIDAHSCNVFITFKVYIIAFKRKYRRYETRLKHGGVTEILYHLSGSKQLISGFLYSVRIHNKSLKIHKIYRKSSNIRE